MGVSDYDGRPNEEVMEELKIHGRLRLAAARVGLGRKTAAKYRDAGKLPSADKGAAGSVISVNG